MKTIRKMWGLIMLTLLPHIVSSQLNTGQDPANTNAQNTIFYFDSNSDCNGKIREVYGFQARIRGNDLTSVRLGPKSCTIILRASGQFDGTVLDIEIIAMNIQDCSTQVSIFDGDGPNLPLMSFDCYSNLNQNRWRFSTTGNTGTFVMTRENINSFNFDIEIRITPMRGGTDPGYENNYGRGYFFDKFPQTYIVAMIGGFYGLILVICTVIVILFCCKYQKLHKKWETQQLATIKSGPAFDTKSQPSNAWSVEMKQSQGPGSQYSLGPQPRKIAARSEDGDSNIVYNVDAFQTKRLVKAENDKSRSRYESSNVSYSEPEDDSDHFVEKIITPRVKTNSNWRKPPPYEDATSDHVSDNSSDEESEVSSSTNSSVRKRPLSTETERSEISGSSYTHSESEAVSEGESARSNRGRGARAQRRERKSHKKTTRKRADQSDSGPSRPSVSQQQLAHPQIQQPSYGAYPPGQFVPVMVGHNQFQQVTMVPAFPPPSYSEQPTSADATPRSQVQPTDPPVYSYLVRRGYTPLDARSTSQASTANRQKSRGGRLEEPELRLDSGVEYMRR